jgi:hypothetical protein
VKLPSAGVPDVDVPSAQAPTTVPDLPGSSGGSGVLGGSGGGAGGTATGTGAAGGTAGTAGAGGVNGAGAGRTPGAPGQPAIDLGGGGYGAIVGGGGGALGGTIGAALPAPLARLLAYVWPAVALGGATGNFLMPLLARLEEALGLPVSAGIPRLLSALAGGIAGAAAVSGSPSQPAAERPESPAPHGPLLSLPEGGMSLLVTLLTGLLALVGAVALARLLYGDDLFYPRRWRGHRGL